MSTFYINTVGENTREKYGIGHTEFALGGIPNSRDTFWHVLVIAEL